LRAAQNRCEKCVALDAVPGSVQQKLNDAVTIRRQDYKWMWQPGSGDAANGTVRKQGWEADMPIFTGCKLYVDGELTTVGYSMEDSRRRAGPYMLKRRRLKIESYVASAPTQVWAYDYDIEAWVLHRSLAANDGDCGHGSCCKRLAAPLAIRNSQS
jgi:hypothetical protein